MQYCMFPLQKQLHAWDDLYGQVDLDQVYTVYTVVNSNIIGSLLTLGWVTPSVEGYTLPSS